MPILPALAVATAAAGVGATIYGADKASKAAKNAGQLTANADQAALDLQQRVYDQNRADVAPFRAIGLTAAQALAASFGLPVTGAGPSMTGPTAAPAGYYAPAPAGGGYGGYYAPTATPSVSRTATLSMTGATVAPPATAPSTALRASTPVSTAPPPAGTASLGTAQQTQVADLRTNAAPSMTGAPPSNEVPYYDWNPEHTTGVLIRGATPEHAAGVNGIVPSYVAGLSGANTSGIAYGSPGSGAGLEDVIGSGSAYGWDPIQAQDNNNYLDGDASTGFTRGAIDPVTGEFTDPYTRQYYGLAPLPGQGSMTGAMTGASSAAPEASPQNPLYPAAAGAAPAGAAPATAGGPDWNAYWAANPDLAADPSLANSHPGDLNGDGTEDNADRAEWHYQHYGQNEGRGLPTTQPSMTGGGGGGGAGPAPAPVAPGFTDPTAPYGYTAGPRPEPGPTPATYTPGPSPTYVSPDLSGDAYHESPGYKFQVSEAMKAIGNIASAGGRVFSGQRLKATAQRAGDLADQNFTDWRNFTAGQANVKNAFDRAAYESDRGFGYGQSRDARGDYVTDRTRADGLYNDDRTYNAGRYDQRNNTLLTLAGFGPQANGQNASTAQSFAANSGNLMTNQATALGNAGIGSANAFNSALNNIGTGALYLAGRYGGGTGSMTGGGGYLGPNAGIAPADFSFSGANF
jgi:hypothetical protein